jgi:hypothetical protein
MDDYVSSSQAAAAAGIHPGHLRRLLAQGMVEGARKIGRNWIIPRDWATTFARQRRRAKR